MFNPDIDIPDLSGKVILVTSGNAGLGKETCISLAKHNPKRLLIAARNAKSAESVIFELKALAPLVDCTFIECDLGSLASISKAAKEIVSRTDRLDLLFCNAGILGHPPGLTEDVYEIHFGVNHLGHALLIKQLLPVLLRTAIFQPDVRVIVTSSDGYRFHASEGIVFKDLRTRQLNLSILSSFGGKDSWRRYSQSKLANIVYAVELARRYPTIRFVSVHPGVCDTPLTPGWIKGSAMSRKLFAPGGLKTAKEGSFSQLWAATASDVVNGQYYEPVGIVGYRTSKSKDDRLREELWEWTETQMKTWSF
ncbi:hypothetical protein VTL71DRAFT_10479 [Oculimacula yallundae]|uniref:Uncharacterized protein n=1 Tax=Oculimacula yallundae TaxID=86028 RepID=A0ABR4CT85_9HELO